MVVHILCGVVILLEITNQYVHVFCSAEGLWKAEKNIQILYPWGSDDPKLFKPSKMRHCFHATS